MPRRPSPARLSAWPVPAIAAIGATLSLGGCHYASSPLVGFGPFIGNTHTFVRNPNRPPGSDENTVYSEGREVAAAPLLPEAGNIWPGPPQPVPTLNDVQKLENQQTIPEPQGQPTPNPPPAHRPNRRGSSTPPGPLQTPPTPAPAPPPAQVNPTPPQAGPTAPPVFNTPSGPLINNGPVGVPGGASTATSPTGGGTSIVVPNGNGTSTVIAPDGSTTTIPTPR